MPKLFDADENPVDEADLKPGDFVYGEDGEEFQVQEVDADEVDEDDDDDEPVEKGFRPLSRNKAKAAGRLGRRAWNETGTGTKLGAAAGAGAAGGYAAGRVGKSASARFLEDISKAVTDEERDVVISKAMDQIETVSKAYTDLQEVVASLLGERDHEAFTEVAKGYGPLPIAADELGGVLQRAAAVLPEEDVLVIDRILSGAGEISKQLYVEQGYGGVAASDTYEQALALAGEVVSKSDLGLTQEQALTHIFDHNPAAYDEYLAEQNNG